MTLSNDTDSVARFDTSLATKLFDKLFAFVLALTTFSLAVLLPIAVSVALFQAGLNFSIAIAIIAVAIPCGLYYSWKAVRSKLCFCIIFYPKHLQVGRGFVRCLFSYEDIDMISLQQKNCIIIKCGNKKTKTVLSDESLLDCAKLFQVRCPNAVIVDFDGKEYLPQNPTRPDISLFALEQRYKTKSHFYFLGIIWFSCFLAGHCWVIFQCWQGNIKPDFEKTLGLAICTPAYAIMVFTGIKMMRSSYRIASDIRKKRLNMSNVAHDTYMKIDPIADSSITS